MKDIDVIQTSFRVKKAIDAGIDVLIAQEIFDDELTLKVRELVKTMLPNATLYTSSAIVCYARSRRNAYLHKKVLDKAIFEHMQNDFKTLEETTNNDEASN